MMENIYNLPGDVVMEILLFLPSKSLMRFKCVCKSWHALISSPQFISMHLNLKNNTCLLIKHRLFVDATGKKQDVLSLISDLDYDATEKKQNVLSLISDLDNDFSSIVSLNVDIPFHCICQEPYVELVGHHNGIICLSYCWGDVFLCNPAMKEFRVLPRSCIPEPSDPNVAFHQESVGLGYDCQTNDYKVVRIKVYWNYLIGLFFNRVEVYTLSTDSWREIKDVQLEVYILPSQFQMHLNGVYYWRAQMNDTTELILTFDMANELFQKIPIPESEWNYYRSLMVFNESIALVCYPYNVDKKSFDFWVMDEFGVKGSWKKLFSIGPLPGIEMPLVFWKNNELLMEGKDGKVISYNLKTQEIRNLPIYGIPYNFTAAIYLNSGVSIKPS